MNDRVLVVGGGFAGACCALDLAQRGFCVTLLDKGELKQNHDVTSSAWPFPVIAVSAQTIAYWQQLGVWQAISTMPLGVYRRMRVFDGQGDGEITFSAQTLGVACLGALVSVAHVLPVIYRALRQQPNVTLVERADLQQVEHHAQHITLYAAGGRYWQGDALVAADGARSWLRAHLKQSYREHNYQQQALVAHVAMEKSHQQTAWQVFLAQGPCALLPLQGAREVSIVWTADDDRAQYLQQQDNAGLARLLQQAWGDRFGGMQIISERCHFPLWYRECHDYHHDRVVFVGDAARSIHPLAGQGANLGIDDVRQLAMQWGTLKKQGKPWYAARYLAAYTRQRKAACWPIVQSIKFFQRFFAGRHWGGNSVALFGDEWVSAQSCVN